MSAELKALQVVLTRLNQLKIPYMLTGSMALHYYATPRMTRDIDIVVQINDKDVSGLMQTFENDFYIDDQMIKEAILQQGLFNIVHNDSVTKIDFIVKKTGPYRKKEFDRRKKMNLNGVEGWIVSPEDLIISKLDWAKESFSELQLRDIENIFRSVSDLDLDYITEWVENLGLREIFKKVKK